MINLETFATENLGKKVAYDAADDGECTAIPNLWLVANGLPPIICNAIDFMGVKNSAYEVIPNTPTNVPSEGDLVVFEVGEYGHVDIFVSGDVNSFKGLDQNWPLESPVAYVEHNYTDPKVLGFVHPKAFTPAAPAFPVDVTVDVGELNVRTEANETSQSVMLLKEGSIVTVTEQVDGGQYQILSAPSNQWYKTYAGHFIAVDGTK